MCHVRHTPASYVGRCTELTQRLASEAALIGTVANAAPGDPGSCTAPGAAPSAEALLQEEPNLAGKRQRLEAQRDTLRKARRLLAAF